jgi:precorrin-2 dehydrogenase / sirohydrochlorin ferrochelatase
VPVDEPGYPVNLLVAGRRVLVVGGGEVAAQKAKGLLEAGAVVHVVATEVRDDVRDLPLTWEERPYRRGEVAGYRLAVACTDDPAANQAVYDDGEAAGVWVNAADDPERCSYTLPARVRQGRLLVTVSTGGHSPAVASWLRARLEAELGEEYDTLIGLLADERARLRAEGISTEGLDWRGALDSGMLELIRTGQLDAASASLRAALGRVDATGAPHQETATVTDVPPTDRHRHGG